MEGDCVVGQRGGQVGRVQGLDVGHAHGGLVGQHAERKKVSGTVTAGVSSIQRTAHILKTEGA